MKIAKTFSRFGGEEFLLVNQSEILREVSEAVQESQGPAEKISELLIKKSWRLLKTPFGSAHSHFIQKNRILLGLQNDVSLVHHFYYAYEYETSTIDVAITILPADSGTFEKALEEITKNGKMSPRVPLLILAIEPD